ncbi:nicotinate phosphoribosyltransferase [Lentilactobacillus buchneri]|nr:nicotinate phosphoribosyltransferase [Lentilactobacillus sp. Egmn17]
MSEDDNLTLHTDFYEINMMATYFEKHMENRKAVFEVFFRKLPFGNGYAVFAGLEHIISYIENLQFTDDDIDYLREVTDYPDSFLEYLRNFEFKGTIKSAYEGDIVFANEPILQVEGSLCECQLVETAILNMVNYQTLIATKASRIRTVVGDDPLMEFGTRRAQEVSAALWGTRATIIGGFNATSNVLAGKKFGIPISGTHAHSLVESFGNDYDAFNAYAQTHHDCVFLVDTYKRVREVLDNAGYPNTKIYASNDLDETTIASLKMQHAKIDVWGVGTKVITAFDQPALGAVYKMVSVEDADGKMTDTIKISGNAEKVSTPGKKQVWRITDSKDGKSEGDYVTLADEDPRKEKSIFMFHPNYTYINKTVDNFDAIPLLKPIFQDGKLVYDQPNLKQIVHYAEKELASLWPEYKRELNPQKYPVDLSQKCWDNKRDIIEKIRNYIQDINY